MFSAAASLQVSHKTGEERGEISQKEQKGHNAIVLPCGESIHSDRIAEEKCLFPVSL